MTATTTLHATTGGSGRDGQETALMTRVECGMQAVRQETTLIGSLLKSPDRVTVAYDGLTVAYDRIREHLHRLSQLLRRLADLFQRLGVLHRQRLQLPEAFLWGQLAMLIRLNAGNIRAIAIRGHGDPVLTALILGHGFLLEHGLDLLRYGQRLLERRQPLRHHTPYRKGAR